MEDIGVKILKSMCGNNDPLSALFGSIDKEDINNLVNEFKDSPWAQLLIPPVVKQQCANCPMNPCGSSEKDDFTKILNTFLDDTYSEITDKKKGTDTAQFTCRKDTVKTPPGYNSLWSQVLTPKTQLYPQVDIRGTESQIIIIIDIPGVNKDNIKLNILGNNELIVEVDRTAKINSDTFLLKERHSGLIRRVITLPKGIDTNPSASYRDGVLTVTFNKLSCVDEKMMKNVYVL
jgi:HSP20 family molecular chaperone IbpA